MSAVYDKARQSFLSQSPSIDMDSDSIKVALVGTYTVNLATHQYVSDLTNIVVRSAALTSVAVTAGVFSAANPTISAVSGSTVNYLVLFDDTPATDATKPLVAYIDTGTGLPFTPNGGDVTISWDTGANKIFKL
jgi:hypothetical protein